MVLFYIEEEQHNCYSKYDFRSAEIMRISGICAKLYHPHFFFSYVKIFFIHGKKKKGVRFTCKLRQSHSVKATQSIRILCVLWEGKKSFSCGKIRMKTFSAIEEEEEKLTSILKCNWIGSEVLMIHL